MICPKCKGDVQMLVLTSHGQLCQRCKMMHPKLATVKLWWANYRRHCYGDGPLNPVQEKETRQAYYSGMLDLLGLTVTMADQLPEDEAEAELNRIRKEILAFIDPNAQ